MATTTQKIDKLMEMTTRMEQHLKDMNGKLIAHERYITETHANEHKLISKELNDYSAWEKAKTIIISVMSAIIGGLATYIGSRLL